MFHNVINSNVGTGLDVRRRTNRGTIRCNLIGHNEGTGISVAEGASYNLFRRNVIQLSGEVGIWLHVDAGWSNDFGSDEDPGWNWLVGNGFWGMRVDTEVGAPSPWGTPGVVGIVLATGNWWGCPGEPTSLYPDCDQLITSNPAVTVEFRPTARDCSHIYYDFMLGDCLLVDGAASATAGPTSGSGLTSSAEGTSLVSMSPHRRAIPHWRSSTT